MQKANAENWVLLKDSFLLSLIESSQIRVDNIGTAMRQTLLTWSFDAEGNFVTCCKRAWSFHVWKVEGWSLKSGMEKNGVAGETFKFLSWALSLSFHLKLVHDLALNILFLLPKGSEYLENLKIRLQTIPLLTLHGKKMITRGSSGGFNVEVH